MRESVTGFTAGRMLDIEQTAVVEGEVVGDDLHLTRKNGVTFNAGRVRGNPGTMTYDELTEKIGETVPGKVTEALAADEAPALAAAAAAETAVDIELNTSPRIPKIWEDAADNYAVVWRSRVGRRLLAAITRSGAIAPQGGVALGNTLLRGGSDTALQRATTFATTAPLAHDRLGEDALSSDGTVPEWVLRRWSLRMYGASNPKGRGIVCRGDSLTAGAYGLGTSYPQHLSTLIGAPVAKRGAPGERAKEISMRQGSTPLATTNTITIPASGSVTVPMNTTLMFTNPDAVNGVPDGTAMVGTLNGVRGTLTITGGEFTFTRSTNGQAIDVPTGTPWFDDFASTHRDWNQIIWVGRNNITTTPADVATYVAKMVSYQMAGDYLVLSVTNATNEPVGSANHTTITNINAALATAYPRNYFDLRSWLITSGLAAVQIAATQADTTAISEDRIPPSLLANDGLHFNAAGYRAIAIGIAAHIATKGWI